MFLPKGERSTRCAMNTNDLRQTAQRNAERNLALSSPTLAA
jgi:hypothetical protein